MSELKRFRRAAVMVGAFAMVLAGCGGSDDGGSDDTSTDAEAGDAEADDGAEDGDAASGEVLSSITIGINNPNYATQVPTILAIEKGWFEDEGITDVEIIETDDYVAGVVGGSLHLAQGDTDVILGSANASGEDIRWLGTYRNYEWRILGVGPDVEGPEDLVGANLTGGALGGRNQLLLEGIVEELGIDRDDVNWVPQGGNSDATLQAIISGTVDGGSLFPRHKVALEEAGGHFLYQEFFEMPQEGVFAMGDFVEENRATVEAYWRAILKAREYFHDESNKEEVLQIMRDNGFEIPEEFEEVYDLEYQQISIDGGFDPAKMDELIDQQIDLGNLDEGFEWRPYVDLEPLWAAQEALGIDRNPAEF